MSDSSKIKKSTLIFIAGILFASLTSMPSVNAQRIQTSLTIAVPREPQWKKCTIEATLKDKNDNPLQDMDICFFYAHRDDGTYCEHQIDTVKTDSNGLASLTYIFPGIETFRFHAVFLGTTNYAPSTSEYVHSVFVFIDNTPYIVGGGLIAVAIIGIVGYIVFRRRKKG